ncbi:MAG: choice-of-anchor B family protein [Flavobacteriales bacterium]|nr:choice-of-anchor B family protein [Flavobacteriales bacterium]
MIKILAFFAFIPFFMSAQLNMSELGYFDVVSLHNSDASDIWGYVDGNGNEYAIVGLNDGTSIVDVTDPANPFEVFFEPGMNSIWRDIKTWGNYAYVTTEEPQGLLIIDLSTLPGNSNLTTTYYNGPGNDQWASAHNLFIDENGICYIFGANRGNGGAIMLDLTIDPMNPVELGIVDNWYAHDGVARGDTLYMGHINDGHMSIWDVSDKANPIILGQQVTPGNFSHNLWMSDDGDYIYTTDEITNGYIGEFDISDPTNIVELDRIQSNPGMDVIPHNSHFIDDYIVTSYYRDGVTVHDVSNKGNMVEVGNFDTSPSFSGDGFNGCWGVYPWLPSGNIITSDIENGLHILGVTYNRGSYLEGTVTDASTTAPIFGVTIELVTTIITDQTNIVGDYATGYAVAGSYDIIYSHPAYIADTVFGVSLVSGQVSIQDAQLVPIENFDLLVSVDELANIGTFIPNADVIIENDDFTYSGSTDGNGEIIFSNFYGGTYNVYIGKWGFIEVCGQDVLFGSNDSIYSGSLEAGYADFFNLDLGWQVSGAAPDGIWERGVPIGTIAGGSLSNPDMDAADCGSKAYVTGNGGGSAGFDDVDFADAILTSPLMDLSDGGADPIISLDYWWRNFSGQVFANDSLTFIIDDGIDQYKVAEFYQDSDDIIWRSLSIDVTNYTSVLTSIRLIVKTADWDSEGGNLVEAGLDNFRVDYNLNVNEGNMNSDFSVYPNPSNEVFNLTFGDNVPENLIVIIYDVYGKLVSFSNLKKQDAIINIEHAGVYTMQIVGENYLGATRKIIKL